MHNAVRRESMTCFYSGERKKVLGDNWDSRLVSWGGSSSATSLSASSCWEVPSLFWRSIFAFLSNTSLHLCLSSLTLPPTHFCPLFLVSFYLWLHPVFSDSATPPTWGRNLSEVLSLFLWDCQAQWGSQSHSCLCHSCSGHFKKNKKGERGQKNRMFHSSQTGTFQEC